MKTQQKKIQRKKIKFLKKLFWNAKTKTPNTNMVVEIRFSFNCFRVIFLWIELEILGIKSWILFIFDLGQS